MLFSAKVLPFLSFHILGGVVAGQVPPEWFPRVQQEFSNASFPLRRCSKRENKAPRNMRGCGRKSKTCFFGNQVCGNGEDFPYPAESCTCNGTSSKDRGKWICQPEACPVQECQDATLTEQPWYDLDYDTCSRYEKYGYCPFSGGYPPVANFGFEANEACCTCGGGMVDSATLVCSDIAVPLNPPIQWEDSLGDNCSWYANSPQTRCVDFANERRSSIFSFPEFNLTVGEACCACADIVPPVNPTCTDLPGWNLNNRTCNEMNREDCIFDPEAFGISATEACCKCGARATNPNAPTNFDFPTKSSTAGGCTPNKRRFNMCMKLAPNIAAEDAAVISSARKRWSSIIVQDSPDFQYDFDVINTTGFGGESAPENVADLPAFHELLCGFKPGFPLVDSTDDINTCTVQRSLTPGVIAQAAPIYGDNFARFGVLTVNANEIRDLRINGILDKIILHELGHILGIGSLWRSEASGQLLVDYPACDYLGENANRVYQYISECSSVDDTLPIEERQEYTFWLDGVKDTIVLCRPANLLEECFLNELMTTEVKNDTALPLSVVTIAMLEDLGYTVDYSKADPYTKADMSASCVCDNDINKNNGDSLTRMLSEKDRGASRAPKRQLSDEGRATVHEYAKKELKRMNELAMSYMVNTQDEEGAAAVGIPGLTVMFMEDGHIFTEHVMNGEDELMEEAAMAKADEEEIDLEVEDGRNE